MVTQSRPPHGGRGLKFEIDLVPRQRQHVVPLTGDVD